ncbi:hypothetical protein ACQY0O_003629 [Thecaphora frezii]
MRPSTFLTASTSLLTAATQVSAWGCIGNDCTEATSMGQIAFSAPAQPAEGLPKAQSSSFSDAWSWTDCGSDGVIIKDIQVSPDPPRPGQNLTIHAKGSTSIDIRDGSRADVVVKLGLIKLLSREFDICEEARANNAELQCPLTPGDYELSHTVFLPREIPPAKFRVDIQAYNQDDEDLMCLKLTMDFLHRG